MDEILAAGVPLRTRTRAIALGLSSWVALSQPGVQVDLGSIEWSVALFHAVGDPVGEGCALTTLSIACTSTSPPDLERAEKLQQRALELVATADQPAFEALFRIAFGSLVMLRGDRDRGIAILDDVLDDARRQGDVFIECLALTNGGWARLARGEPRPDLFARGLELALQLGHEDGVGFALEGLAACAAATDDVERAGLLLGAGETVRLRTGLVDQRPNLTYRPHIDRILASDRAAEFEAARARGRRMSRRTALDLVLDPAGAVAP
jgi:hypothetical protein